MNLLPISRRAFYTALIFTVAILLVGAGGSAAADGKPVHLLIVAQKTGDGHPPTTHEFMGGAHVMQELLKPYKNVEVTLVNGDEPWADGPGLIDKADGIMLWVTQGAKWMQIDADRFAAIKRLSARGGSITAFHWSVGSTNADYIKGQLDLLGGTRGGTQRKYKVLEADVKRVNPRHPILNGVGDFKTYDEFYYRLDLRPEIKPLLQANIDGNDETCAWAWERPDGGRSFGWVCIHFHANWQAPEYRRVALQGVLWSLKIPIPAGGANVDLDSKTLELDGVLPPPASPESEKAAKKLKKPKI